MNAITAIGRTLRGLERVAPGLAAEGAYLLWRTPGPRPAVRAHERAVLAEAVRGTVDAAGRRIRTYRWGDGPERVLLVHGWQSRAGALAPIAAALRHPDRTVIAIDLPAHGESGGRRTDIVECATVLADLGRAAGGFDAVVAHSYGAAVAAYAMTDGLGVGRLASVSAAGEPEYFLRKFGGMLGLSERMTRGIAERTKARVFGRVPERWDDFIATPWRVPADVPLLLVHDDTDGYVEPSQADELQRVNPHAEVLRTRGLGHNRILRDAYVIDAIAEFASR